jgi:sulfite oxidase
MNCTWKGPRLRDVIEKAGIDVEKLSGKTKMLVGHAAFACYEQQVQDDSWYGGAIPLERATSEDADVILALQMNGKPLKAEHGAPVRVIVPGVAGARSVKWLNKITIQKEDSENFYQQHDYKILPPEATDMEKAEHFWGKVDPLMDMPVNSIIGVPEDEEAVKADDDGLIEVRGYALPHGRDGPVTKVEVSGDGGKSWVEAELDYGSYGDLSTEESREKVKWAWCLWTARVPVAKGRNQRVVSRATDAGGNTQEERSAWNIRGVGYNGWGCADGLTIV